LYEPFKDRGAVKAADAVRDLGRVGFVVHQQELELANVVNQELFVPIGQEMASLSV
jgi:hypothetical protein